MYNYHTDKVRNTSFLSYSSHWYGLKQLQSPQVINVHNGVEQLLSMVTMATLQNIHYGSVTRVMVWNTCYRMATTVRGDSISYRTQGTSNNVFPFILGFSHVMNMYMLLIHGCFYPRLGCVWLGEYTRTLVDSLMGPCARVCACVLVMCMTATPSAPIAMHSSE